MEQTQDRWIGRTEALSRLGVKTQTLYAYVSRGRITARPDPRDPRRSLYAAEDVARLKDGGASVARPPVAFAGAAARGEAGVDSSQTVISGGRLFYRGMDAIQLSRQALIEDVARLLWAAGPEDPFRELKPRVDTVVGGSCRARIYAALARRAEEDAPAGDRDRPTLAREAASLINELIDSLAGPGPRLHLHQRLARGFKVGDREGQLLRRALILGADHDMSAATLATRVAAGAGASPAGAAMAGVLALRGSPMAERLEAVNEMVTLGRRDPAEAVRARLVDGEAPGFGNRAYPAGDPRAAALLEAAELPADLMAFVTEGEALTGRKASFELALALLARRLELPRDGALDLLILGRVIGLIGHALDQKFDGSPIRARLRYLGPEPGAN